MTLPTIYYIGSLPPRTGGELVNLQHVASLHQQGVRAVALVNACPQADEAAAAQLPLEVLAPGRQFGADDIVVIPEFYREAFAHFARQPCRKVLHNQGPFLTFRGFDSIEQMNAAGLTAGLSCSRFCIDLMQRMGSAQTWQLVRPFVHPMFQRGAPKRLQVAHMPDKRPREAPVVRALLRHKYPQWAAVPWVGIAGLSRQACAAVLAESALFASFSWLEGLGLPPLEAMASGCLVGGFDGQGGRDHASADNGLWVAEGDHEGFADALAAGLAIAQAGGAAAQRRIDAGLATAAQYSQARFERELLAAWGAITGPAWGDYQRASAGSAGLAGAAGLLRAESDG
jgi:hypothetical protein